MERQARWTEVASDQYFALPAHDQRTVDTTVRRLLAHPDGVGCSYDPTTDRWTTTADEGRLLLVYSFRPSGPWLIIFRLVVI